jgi:Flp pilus assembly protein protease CpaA
LAPPPFTCFYLVMFLIRSGDMGPGDVKLAANIGLARGWAGWRALLAGFTLTAV